MFFQIWLLLKSTLNQSGEPIPKLRSRANETHIVFSDVRLVYVKPSFMGDSEFVAQKLEWPKSHKLYLFCFSCAVDPPVPAKSEPMSSQNKHGSNRFATHTCGR